MATQKKTSLSLKQKLRIIRDATDNTKAELCAKYGVCKSTLSRILRDQDTILEKSKTSSLTTKRFRKGARPEVDKALTTWYNQMKASGVVVSSNMVMKKAKEFAEMMKQSFKPSPGWLWRWQKREGIHLRKAHRENHSDIAESVDNFCEYVLPNLIKNYTPENIFNANESGLLYKALPPTLTNSNEIDLPKEHLTLLFICNATGSYKKVVVIGRSRKPLAFQGKTLPLEYYSNKTACMTQDLWNTILTALDEEMTSQDRKIVLFVDNATCHKTTAALTNVNVHFLQASTSSIVQPLNQGIIDCFKSHYRENIIQKRVSAVEREDSLAEFVESISVMNALHIINHAWLLVKPTFITNCFQKAKFLSQSPCKEEYDEDVLCSNTVRELLTEEEFQSYVRCDANLMCRAQASDEDIIEEILPESLTGEPADAPDENDIMENPPSLQEALVSLNTLRNFLLSKNMYASELESIEEYLVKELFKKKSM